MSIPENQLATTRRVDVSLQRSTGVSTHDQVLWSAIRNRTDAIGFNRYAAFIARLLGEHSPRNANGGDGVEVSALNAQSIRDYMNDFSRSPNVFGAESYRFLKAATYAFLMFQSGVVVRPHDGNPDSIVPGEETRLGEQVTYAELQARLRNYLGNDGTLPYFDRITNALVGLDGRTGEGRAEDIVLRQNLLFPNLLELIWSFWHEKGMLVQSMNYIALRFQNRRANGSDPLAHLEIDPLRPLNNFVWGYIQDEINRLSVARRAYEYDHQYGLSITGRATAEMNPADSRSKFIEAFHNLLHRAANFYQEDAITTMIADGFPALNALKEVHLILAEGAHNQFGDLPTAARAEMMMMQWLLARPEMREFLRGRAMVPYREPWMGQVDTMKRLKGWTDVGANHFRDLATFGEQLLLSIRYGDWIDVNDQEQARNWARYWKPEVQSYIHSYLAVTGVDLAAEITESRPSDRYLQPAVHMRNRLVSQTRRSSHALSGTSRELLSDETSTLAPAMRRLIPSRQSD